MAETASIRLLQRLARNGARLASAGRTAPTPAQDHESVSEPPPPISPEPGAPARFARELQPQRATDADQIVSRRLYERLSAADIGEIEAAIARDDQLQAYYIGAPDSRHGSSCCSASASG